MALSLILLDLCSQKEGKESRQRKDNAGRNMFSFQTQAIRLTDKNQTCVCTPGTWEPEQTGLGAWMISLNRITRALGALMLSGSPPADLALWQLVPHLAALDQLLLGRGVLVGHGRILGGGDGLRGCSCSLLGCNLGRTVRGGEAGFTRANTHTHAH